MSLGVRLVFLGAIVPALALLVALAIGRAMFAREIFAAVDDAMRTQAAVESVSLFDLPEESPHLHLHRSSLTRVADPSAVALYDADGAPVRRFPESSSIPDRIDPMALAEDPVLRSVIAPTGHRRELRVRVRSPDGRPWALWLGHDMGPHDAAIAAFDRTAALLVMLVTLALFAIQLMHAARLTHRIQRLAAHMRRIREGDLSENPEPDPSRDLVGELRDSISDATARLRAASDARERLIADAAHELRTPLATMRAEIDITLRRDRSPVELRDALERTREEVERLTATAADLLELASGSRVEEPRENTNVIELVMGAVETMRAYASERAVLVQVHAAAAVDFECAPRTLRRAIDNLLVNAVSVSPPGANVDVMIESEPSQVRLRVCDRGPGLPDSEREAVFEPFHRLDRARIGTGLGLAIVRDVASRHGGRAFARNRRDGGAEFVLELPFERSPHSPR
jgi:signal transduction histidine kinase